MIPSSLAETLSPDVMKRIEDALAPPMPLRTKERLEFEVEAAGEGTFTIVVDNGVVSAKKGFAKDPLVSAQISRGGWPLVQRALEAVCTAPSFAKVRSALSAPKPGELDAVVLAFKKIDDAALRLDVKGAASFAIARGSVDEATHEVTVSISKADIDALIGGAAPASVRVDLGGDKGVLAKVLAALGPVAARLRV